MLKWYLLGIIILLFIPFYFFILSKCISLGKIYGMREAFRHLNKTNNKEEMTNGKEEK